MVFTHGLTVPQQSHLKYDVNTSYLVSCVVFYKALSPSTGKREESSLRFVLDCAEQ